MYTMRIHTYAGNIIILLE